MNTEPAKTWQRLNSALRAFVLSCPSEMVVAVPLKCSGDPKVHPDQEGFSFAGGEPEGRSEEVAASVMEVEIVRQVHPAWPVNLKATMPYLRYKGTDLEIKKLNGVTIVPGMTIGKDSFDDDGKETKEYVLWLGRWVCLSKGGAVLMAHPEGNLSELEDAGWVTRFFPKYLDPPARVALAGGV